jgi:hypothetical protein
MSQTRLPRSVVFMVLMVAACSAPPLLGGGDYDRSCHAATDCVTVGARACPGTCNCNVVAISAHEEERWNAEANRRPCTPAGGPVLAFPGSAGCDCLFPGELVCEQDLCGFGVAPRDAGP